MGNVKKIKLADPPAVEKQRAAGGFSTSQRTKGGLVAGGRPRRPAASARDGRRVLLVVWRNDRQVALVVRSGAVGPVIRSGPRRPLPDTVAGPSR